MARPACLTPPETLTRARRIAHAAGLQHVYTGNVRDWHLIRDYALTESGACPQCGTKLAGSYGKFEEQFGRQRIPVHIA